MRWSICTFDLGAEVNIFWCIVFFSVNIGTNQFSLSEAVLSTNLSLSGAGINTFPYIVFSSNVLWYLSNVKKHEHEDVPICQIHDSAKLDFTMGEPESLFTFCTEMNVSLSLINSLQQICQIRWKDTRWPFGFNS